MSIRSLVLWVLIALLVGSCAATPRSDAPRTQQQPPVPAGAEGRGGY